jgi:hypothetical protein
MLHTPERHDHPYAVRGGQSAPVTCVTCGCRLDDLGDGSYGHFQPLGGRDARGCRVACVELLHDSWGRAVAA